MRKAIITWASQWLWLELCKHFIKQWYQVIWLSRSRPIIENIIHLETNFSDKENIEIISKKILSEHWEFDTIIHCAWIWYIENIEKTDYDHTEEMFQVNITWQHHLLSLLSSKIRSNNVDIVFIWATIWYKANEFMPLYSVTKRWLRWLVENRRANLKGTKSRVLHISPGWLQTESNIWPNGRETIISKSTWKPVGQFMEPSIIAEFIYSTLQLPKNIELSEIIINRK